MAALKRKLLVVEDDAALSDALEQGLMEQGYEVVAVYDSGPAMAAIERERFHGAIVDCILPSASGIDLSANLIRVQPTMAIALTTDTEATQEFLLDIREKVPHAQIFQKPYEVRHLIAWLRKVVFMDRTAEQIHQEALHSANGGDSLAEALTTAGLKTCGFALPWVIGSLLRSGGDGCLQVTGSQNSTLDLHFQSGVLVGVSPLTLDPPDLTASEEQVAFMAEMKAGEAIGAFVKSADVELKLRQGVLPPNHKLNLGGQEFQWILSGWIACKVEKGWLDSFFRPCLDCLIVDLAHDSKLAPEGLPGVREAIRAGVTVRQLFTDKLEHPDAVARYLYKLVCEGNLYFDKSRTWNELNAEREDLESILIRIEGSDAYGVLGLNPSASAEDAKIAFKLWSEAFRAGDFPDQTPDSLRILAEMIGEKIRVAFDVVIKSAPESAPAGDPGGTELQNRLDAESLFEEGKKLVKKYDGLSALRKFEQAIMTSAAGQLPEFSLYCMWAQLLNFEKVSAAGDALKTLQSQMDRLPHCDRNSSTYFFVRGLIEKRLLNFKAATKNFRNAMKLQRDFVEAQRELNILKLQHSKFKFWGRGSKVT